VIYLASPYSHPDPAIREERFQAACRATFTLLRAGAAVFSPIVHGHPLVGLGLATDWESWQRVDRAMLERCDEVMVLMLAGWESSSGVREEIRMARELGRFGSSNRRPPARSRWPTSRPDRRPGQDCQRERPPRTGADVAQRMKTAYFWPVRANLPGSGRVNRLSLPLVVISRRIAA